MSQIKRNSELSPFYSDLLDDFVSTGFLTADERRGIPALNVKEEEEELVLELRIPGLQKENIKLDYRNGILTLSGERREEKEEKGKYLRREFSSYSFHRSIELPEEKYNVAEAEASYKDGILEVKMPKFEPKDKLNKTIEVK